MGGPLDRDYEGLSEGAVGAGQRRSVDQRYIEESRGVLAGQGDETPPWQRGAEYRNRTDTNQAQEARTRARRERGSDAGGRSLLSQLGKK
jgi:hypothetical protein